MISFAEFVDSIPEVDNDTNYHFIRTDKGAYFDTFYDKNFVAIGYNAITIHDILHMDEAALREKAYGLIPQDKIQDLTEQGLKSKISSIIGTVRDFHSIRKGDIVVIPDEGSTHFAFGIIDSEATEIDNDHKHNCPYNKRRGVHWIKVSRKSSLHGRYQLIRTQKALTSLNYMSEYIDPIVSGVYKKDNSTFLRIRVDSAEPIPLSELNKSLSSIEKLILLQQESDEEFEEPTVRINLNSPGDLLIKLRTSAMGTLVAFIIFTACTRDPEEPDQEVVGYIEDQLNIENGLPKINSDTAQAIVSSARALRQRMDMARND